MKAKKALFERYPHLLHEQADPETVALVEQLDIVYRTPEPPAHLTLGAVLAQLEDEDTPARSPVALWSFRPVFWLPRRASTVLVAVALAVVLMAGSVYAFTSFLRPGLEPPPFDPGLSQIFKEHLLEEVQVAPQTIDGFTMNVQAAYVDPNQVVIGYTMTMPSGSYNSLVPSDALLTTPQGERLHWEMNGPLSDHAYTLTFTPLTWISSDVSHISFHLTVHQLDVNSGAQHLTLHGSMSFTFSAPFHAGRIASPNLSATANGVTLTLTHVVVSPSATRFFVQGADGATDLYPTLSVGGKQIKSVPIISEGPVNADEILINLDVPLFDQYGEWTLSLQVGMGLAPPASTGTGDPWTFQFVVP